MVHYKKYAHITYVCLALLSIYFVTLSAYKVTPHNSKIRSNNDAYRNTNSNNNNINPMNRIKNIKQYCVGTEFTPLVPIPEDKEYWRTSESSIVPIQKELFATRPEVVTFEPFGVLIEPSQSIGRWYRECLNLVCEMKIRLPRPALFTASFNKAFNDMSKAHPCFGSTPISKGMTTREWWYQVVHNTYKGTENLNQISDSEMETLLPKVFEMLYKDVFSTKAGWLVKEDAIYTLNKLKDWRDIGAGPKIGVISNFDERLEIILKELGMMHYFDFVITSADAKSSKPSKEIFDLALSKSKVTSVNAAYHIGSKIESDVAGAAAAGWTPLLFNEWFDEDFPDWSAVDTPETAESSSLDRQKLMQWGRKDTKTGLEWYELWGIDDILTLSGLPIDEKKTVRTTYIRGVRDD